MYVLKNNAWCAYVTKINSVFVVAARAATTQICQKVAQFWISSRKWSTNSHLQVAKTELEGSQMCDNGKKPIDEAVLEVVKSNDGLTPPEMWSQLEGDGYQRGDIRDTVARLNDEGEIEIGSDLRMRSSQ